MTDELVTTFTETVGDNHSIDLDRFESHFSYKDQLNEKGFLPAKPLRFLRACAVDVIKDNLQFLHGLLMPNPKNLIANSQSNALDEDEQSLVHDVIDEYASLMVKSRKLSLNGDADDEEQFLRQAMQARERTEADMKTILDAVDSHWEEQRNE